MAKGRSCLSFIFGFITAFIVMVGIVVGGGFWIYKTATIRGVENTFNFNLPLEEDSGIKDKTVEKLIKELTTMLSDTDNLSISTLETYFGLTSLLPDEVLGISLSPIKNASFSNMEEGLRNFVDGITLEKLSSPEGLNISLPDIPIINEMKTQSITDGFTTLAQSLDTNTLRVSDLQNKFGLNIENNKFFQSIIAKDTDENPILLSQIGDEISNLTFGEVFSDEDLGTLSAPLYDKKISEFSTAINGLKLNELLTINSESSKFLQAIQNKTIDDLQDPSFVSNLRIKDIFDNPTSIIQSILEDEVEGNEETYVTVSNLQDKLTVKIAGATLYNLKSWGCLEGLHDEDLNKVINIGSYKDKKIGELTVEELTYAAISALTQGS